MVIVATITITSESPEETKILIMSLTSESKEKTKSCKHRESASALSRLQEPLKIQKNRQVGCCEWDSFLHGQYVSKWFQLKKNCKRRRSRRGGKRKRKKTQGTMERPYTNKKNTCVLLYEFCHTQFSSSEYAFVIGSPLSIFSQKFLLEPFDALNKE